MTQLMQGLRERVRAKREKGFTLIEVLVVGAMLAGVLGAVTMGIQACHRATEEMERKAVVTRAAASMMDRLFQVEFGNGSDGPPTSEQLTELFDEDDDYGSTTLTTLILDPQQQGYQFTLAEFPYNGIWEVRVGADLDLDGTESGEWEGRDDLVRVDIYYGGVLVLSSMRTTEAV